MSVPSKQSDSRAFEEALPESEFWRIVDAARRRMYDLHLSPALALAMVEDTLDDGLRRAFSFGFTLRLWKLPYDRVTATLIQAGRYSDQMFDLALRMLLLQGQAIFDELRRSPDETLSRSMPGVIGFLASVVDLTTQQRAQFGELARARYPGLESGRGNTSLGEQGFYHTLSHLATLSPAPVGTTLEESYAIGLQIRAYLYLAKAAYNALLLREAGRPLLWRHLQEVCIEKSMDLAQGIAAMFAVARYDLAKADHRDFPFEDNVLTMRVIAPVLGFGESEGGGWRVAGEV